MTRIISTDLVLHVGERVRVQGWLHATRALGKINFLILRDRKGLIQVVIEDKQTFREFSGLQVGSVLSIEADVAQNAQTHLRVELINPKISVDVVVTEPPLIDYFKPEISSDLDFILDHRALALRNRKLQAVFKIQAEISHAYRLYMHDVVDAVEYFSPNLIAGSSEGGAEFFNVDYFGHTATLAQSSQLYKQVMVGVNERVFALMPFFRAEKSHTSRHLSEGKQFEFEMGFFDHWSDIMDIQEGVIKAILDHVRKSCAAEIEVLDGVMIQAPLDVPFPRLTFAKAQHLYFELSGVDERDEDDLSPAAEKALCQHALTQWGTEFVFITDWKTSKRPFYSYPQDENPELTNTFDLLCAGTEITSGGQRRHTYDSMVEGLALKGLDANHFDDYLSIFKYGMPLHGGFGMGLERLTMTLLKLKNIREASLFPSDPKRIAGNRLKAHVFFGAESIRNEILRLLKSNDMVFKHHVHAETLSSAESAKQRGTALEHGVKAIILRGKQTKKNYQFNLPAAARIDMKAVAVLVKEKCEFEDPTVIKERFGLDIGGIPPWGCLMNLDTFYDESIASLPEVAFNCGLTTESIVMQASDLIQLVSPQMGLFVVD